MTCPRCNRSNDPDAVFCEHCGKPLAGDASPRLRARRYLYAFFLIPVFAALLAVGYYKFILPRGVAAVVNGEEIRRSELDRELSFERKAQEDLYGASVFEGDRGKAFLSRLRYEVLTGMIRERLMLQEARKTGVAVSDADVAAAEARIRASSAMDGAAFAAHISSRYGGEQAFRERVKKKLLVGRFISANVTAGISDPQAAREAVSRWLDGLLSRAVVRVSLAEQWFAAGQGCCKAGSQNPGKAGRMMPGPCTPDGSFKQFLDKFVDSN